MRIVKTKQAHEHSHILGVISLTSEVLVNGVHAVQEGATVESIARKMTREHIHRVIVQRGRKVAGIISALDVLRVHGNLAKAPAKMKSKAKKKKPAKAKASRGAKSWQQDMERAQQQTQQSLESVRAARGALDDADDGGVDDDPYNPYDTGAGMGYDDYDDLDGMGGF